MSSESRSQVLRSKRVLAILLCASALLSCGLLFRSNVYGMALDAATTATSRLAQEPSAAHTKESFYATASRIGAQEPLAAHTKESFYAIASRIGTDKVTRIGSKPLEGQYHNYQLMYEKYLPAYRTGKKLKLLEIGLGCDMNYGPGKSLALWQEYFGDAVDLYFMEYDAACAEKWNAKTEGATIISGDQAKIEDLQRVIDISGGNFDLIIDDGGHSMIQQKTTYKHMFLNALKPGGLLFIEDLQTSYMSTYGGAYKGDTTVEMVKGIIDSFHFGAGGINSPPPQPNAVDEQVMFVDCMREICALRRKPLEF
ncbi:hypothetical protein BDZ88DRAFT_455374 [Geranomyces variabilis]|nr:hypothetical protein BDZ88DRAFT_455374 [Geranomyces variabilis]KAJ3132683.1 hypothetical protein HDU90_006735 [Geranomyces variabilis]